MKILFIHPYLIVKSSMELIRREGHETLNVENAHDALKLLSEDDSIDLIIMDICIDSGDKLNQFRYNKLSQGCHIIDHLKDAEMPNDEKVFQEFKSNPEIIILTGVAICVPEHRKMCGLTDREHFVHAALEMPISNQKVLEAIDSIGQ